MYDFPSQYKNWTIQRSKNYSASASIFKVADANAHRVSLLFSTYTATVAFFGLTDSPDSDWSFIIDASTGQRQYRLDYSDVGGLCQQDWWASIGTGLANAVLTTETLWIPKGGA